MPSRPTETLEVANQLKHSLEANEEVSCSITLKEYTRGALRIEAVALDFITSGFAWDPGEETHLRLYGFDYASDPPTNTILQQFDYSGAAVRRMGIVHPDTEALPLLLVEAFHPGGTWSWSTLSCFSFDPATNRLSQISEQYFRFGDFRWFPNLNGQGPVIGVWLPEPKWNETPEAPWQSERLVLTGWTGEVWGTTERISVSALISDDEARNAQGSEERWDTISHHLRDDPAFRDRIWEFRKDSELTPRTARDGSTYWSNLFELDGWHEIPVPVLSEQEASAAGTVH